VPVSENFANFVAGEHDRPRGLARPQRAIEPSQFSFKKLFYKNKSVQKAWFSVESDTFRFTARSLRNNNLFFSKLTGMLFTVKKNEVPDPIHACPFG
jgi:hypothetical protein